MLKIGQILIPNSKTALNYVSLFTETVRAANDPVTLFLVMEVRGEQKAKAAKQAGEMDKLVSAVAKSLKTTYLTETRVTEYTFEKALSNINHELSTLARRGVSGWYKKLNGLVGVYYQDTLSVSVTGSASSFLLRENEFTNISDSLSTGVKPHPLKTFLHFASGALTEEDIVILSSSTLYNYISLDKLGQSLTGHNLDEATKALIGKLKTESDPTDAFATFIFKVSKDAVEPDERFGLMEDDDHTIVEDTVIADQPATGFDYMEVLRKIGGVLWKIGEGAVTVVVWIYNLVKGRNRRSAVGGQYTYLTQKKSPKRKAFLVVFVIIVFLLLINVIFSNFRNAENESKQEMERLLESASLNVTDAESRLIFDDQNGALEAIIEAKSQAETVFLSGHFESQAKELFEKIEVLFDRLNKVTKIEVETLTTFSVSPDQIVKTANGFLGYNSFTESFEKYENGGTSLIFPKVPDNIDLVTASFPGGDTPVFLASNASLYKLGFSPDSFIAITPTTTEISRQLVGLKIYTNRAYAIDKTNSQIIRFGSVGDNFSSAQAWLNESFDFSQALDLAVDGNLYVLLPDNLLKFTQGAKHDFKLPPLAKPLIGAKKVSAGADLQFIYILDAGNSRILVLTKQGGLSEQLASDRFSDLEDFWVDEGSRTIYVLNGDELLKFQY
ncbi:MAG: hypothetical protein COT91_04215 [Candidatus Doudnabacteria bacterium CG10_big_fil_rev_8_21_14_0_10_41_10]|uniref:PPM-type phosphatase domain-containing protein n=1 Tax=Candidatus Doudnabacteria bacterium CG10_big_fil_rev_8_21_14_0_10_41_10 TaxID=1974551 RepID=A0A2H0VCR1_9BACT|nr:MAG: hypothetical protein COT91_04215 [Candidatus Doudnabacteria bacterium CG10_big_fil_rev_8_21_14_0_10_41_10]